MLLPVRLLALPPAVPRHHTGGAAREEALPKDFHQAADVAGFGFVLTRETGPVAPDLAGAVVGGVDSGAGGGEAQFFKR